MDAPSHSAQVGDSAWLLPFECDELFRRYRKRDHRGAVVGRVLDTEPVPYRHYYVSWDPAQPAWLRCHWCVAMQNRYQRALIKCGVHRRRVPCKGPPGKRTRFFASPPRVGPTRRRRRSGSRARPPLLQPEVTAAGLEVRLRQLVLDDCSP